MLGVENFASEWAVVGRISGDVERDVTICDDFSPNEEKTKRTKQKKGNSAVKYREIHALNARKKTKKTKKSKPETTRNE